MRALNAITLALVAGHATAECAYAERAKRASAPAAGCPYAKQPAKHAPRTPPGYCQQEGHLLQ